MVDQKLKTRMLRSVDTNMAINWLNRSNSYLESARKSLPPLSQFNFKGDRDVMGQILSAIRTAQDKMIYLRGRLNKYK